MELMTGFEVQGPGAVFSPCPRPEPGATEQAHPGRFASCAALARLGK